MDQLASSNKITGFVTSFLLNRYDNPVNIPEFHKQVWDICTSGKKKIAIAAPRSHAKSTAVTHALTLYLFLFRIKKYGIIVSDTESQASQFLGDIKTELLENESIRRLFHIKERLVKDSVTDIVVEFEDGEKFRIQALGAGQKVRGRKWGNKRPDYIICDDLENDEMVENDDIRERFRNWVFRALIPSLSKYGLFIIVGTILHEDSVLMRLIKNKSWTSKLYQAHKDFNDFSEILWPEQWPETELRKIRQNYIDDGYPEGYASEYLNDPTASSESYFKKEDFKDLEDGMRELATNNYAGVDLAISDADRAAYTVIVVGGMDEYKRLIVKHVLRFRGDANDILTNMFEIQKLYNIQLWKVEEGQIRKTLQSEMYSRMQTSGIYLNVPNGAVPTKDKRSRARAIQARLRAGGVYFDKSAPWYPVLEHEMLKFPKGTYKDQVDALAWLGIAINELAEAASPSEQYEEDYEDEMRIWHESDIGNSGRNYITGY